MSLVMTSTNHHAVRVSEGQTRQQSMQSLQLSKAEKEPAISTSPTTSSAACCAAQKSVGLAKNVVESCELVNTQADKKNVAAAHHNEP